MPELKLLVSVEANAGIIGVMPELKLLVSVEANAGIIGVKRRGRN
jgi:hypothetical protein